MLRHLTVVLIVLVSGAVGVGCDNEPGDGKPKAEVGEAQAVESETAEGAPAEGAPAEGAPAEGAAGTKAMYSFNQEGSKLAFVGAKITAKHEGSFQEFSGTVEAVDLDPTKSSVKVEVATPSLVADQEKLTNHLKSPDFFDVEKMPKATFVSTAIAAGGAEGATHTVTGNLNLHGVEKSISFPAKISLAADKADVQAEFVINRKDFGLVYPGMPDDLIKDDVLIKLDIHALPTKQS